ncbi:YfiR family protein [Rhodocytophaga rosea]|uniref:YfiR family protein n=1 Tax=Rhodocytophaga rosea TaxID=2704465 RepID=A0A6C0GQ51_9BACT|nr:YfiR family protein [Rhodocytophaga rosea]QHT70057.1 YfiR family protein [Rhodocytophaga rosea]
MKKGKKIIGTSVLKLLLIAAGVWLFSLPAVAQDIDYKTQSLFIYKFTKYITWPQALSRNDFVIGVYGNSPISEELQVMASLKKAGEGQRIVIKRINSVDEIENLHILYVASSKSRELRSILDKIGKKPTLVVAERDGLAKKGASINFLIMENNTLKFEVNRSELQSRGLSISDELLKVGFIVG